MNPMLTLRARFLLIVFCGAVLPLALIGLWLMRSVERSGESLLRARMDASMQRVVLEVGTHWTRLRSELLDLAEEPEVQQALKYGREPDAARLHALADRYVTPGWPLRAASFRTSEEDGGWALSAGAAGYEPASGRRLLDVTLPVYETSTGTTLGSLRAAVEIGALVPPEGLGAVTVGSVLAVFDAGTGAPLIALPFDPALLEHDRFAWAGEEWITLRQRLQTPPLELVLAAPLTPYSQPFEQAARQGVLALLVVALLGLLVASLLTRRVTASLERLALAADAVSRGELDRHVEEDGTGEITRVARAFNAMTASLQRTLQELAQRQSLVALGEFAATLAHEIRNPLTSVRIDLQRAAEKAGDDARLKAPLARALREVERLNGTVTGVLRLARSGSVDREPVDLRAPLEAAVHAAMPEFDARGAELEVRPQPLPALRLEGDAGALEQCFLNLLHNAAQALDPGGRAVLRLEMEGREVVVSICDTGSGIPPEDLQRIFEPFHSGRPGGTGLGLPVAQRIVAAHGGRLEIESAPGAGTTVRVRLPRPDSRYPGNRQRVM
jgi:signal transduction histidine kinase